MWQIHVTPSGGVVTVDGGDVYADGSRYTLAASSPGTASGDMFVVWQGGSGGGSVALLASLSGLSDPFRVLGSVVLDQASSTFSSRQFVGEPIEVGGGGGGGSDPEAVEVELDSSAGYTAHTDSWSYGDTVTVSVDPTDPNSDTVEKRTYPKFTPFRLYWWEAQHKLLAFHRKVTTNPDGQIVAVSAENPDTNPANSPIEVFTTVAEMP